MCQVFANLLFAIAAVGEVRITYPSGGSSCQVVGFPRWDLPKNAEDHFHYPSRHFIDSVYVFRHVDDTPKGLFLVSVEEEWNYKGNILRSPDKYWLKLSGKPTVRRAKDSEWESASPVMGIFTGPVGLLEYGDHPIEYRGQTYSKPGKMWGSGQNVVLSSGGTWLRLESFTPLKVESDGVTLSARVYVDVFHTASGKKVIALMGSLADFDIDASSYNTGYFLEDRFFVTPLGSSRKRMLICDMSRLVPKP